MSKFTNCLHQCSEAIVDNIERWRVHGDVVHDSGREFAYHALGAAFQYVVAYDWMRLHPSMVHAWNDEARKVGGFANLPVPPDHMIMMALLPAVGMMRAQEAIKKGTVTADEGVLLNEVLRDAARMVRKLYPHMPLSPSVQEFLDLTDDDITRLKGQGELSVMEPMGRA